MLPTDKGDLTTHDSTGDGSLLVGILMHDYTERDTRAGSDYRWQNSFRSDTMFAIKVGFTWGISLID
jgi:hypothetical protein